MSDHDALRRVPLAAMVTAVVAGALWVGAGVAILAPYSAVQGIVRTVPLPIDTLPKLPVVQLALARNQDDIDIVLDRAHDSGKRNIADVRTGNVLDTILFVPGYSFFFIATIALIARSSGRAATFVFGAGVVLTAALAVADLAENQGIALALEAAERGQMISEMARQTMVAASLAKWTLLGSMFLFLGAATALQEGLWRRWVPPVLFVLGIWQFAIITRYAVTLLPSTPAVVHSGRSASMTSTRDALAAGTSAARIAATTRINAAAAMGTAPGMRTSSM